MHNELDRQKIISLLVENDFSYIAFVITPWHLISFRAALGYLENKHGYQMRGVIAVLKHPASGFCLEEENINVPNSFVCSFVSEIKDSEKIATLFYKVFLKLPKRKRKNDFFVITPIFPFYTFNRQLQKKTDKRIISIVTDEGIGSWLTSMSEWAKISSSKKNPFSFAVQRLKLFVFGKRYENSLQRKGLLINCSMFLSRKNHVLLNTDMIPFFLNSLKRDDCSIDYFDCNNDYVLINTEPIDELLINPNSDVGAFLELLNKVSHIFSNLGFSVFLKPHPRENANVYKSLNNLKVIDTPIKISQEEMIASLERKPSFLIGFDSTTLVTTSVFFNVQTISILPLIKDKVFDLSLKHLMGIKTLNPSIKMIDNISEIEDFVLDFKNNI